MTRRRWELIAECTLGRIPEKTAAAIVEFLVAPLTDNPKRVGHRPRRELEGLWTTTRGAYRIVYEVDGTDRQIKVLRIEHRSDVYRPR